MAGCSLTGDSVFTTVRSVWECQNPGPKIPWEAMFAVTKVLSHCWQTNCHPQLGNLPAGEPTSDTWSTNWAVVCWLRTSLTVLGMRQSDKEASDKGLEWRDLGRLPTACSWESKFTTVLISTLGVASITYAQNPKYKQKGGDLEARVF